MPQTIELKIKEKLKQTFGDIENKLFAVRSSAAGEDSEEMSAAGQMTTYLGVKGIVLTINFFLTIILIKLFLTQASKK